jgi:hypothetical protein
MTFNDLNLGLCKTIRRLQRREEDICHQFKAYLLTSIPFIGKFEGCLAAGPLIEKKCHRLVFYVLAVISVVGVISKSASQV